MFVSIGVATGEGVGRRPRWQSDGDGGLGWSGLDARSEVSAGDGLGPPSRPRVDREPAADQQDGRDDRGDGDSAPHHPGSSVPLISLLRASDVRSSGSRFRRRTDGGPRLTRLKPVGGPNGGYALSKQRGEAISSRAAAHVSSNTSGRLRDLPVSWNARTADPEGLTGPEELLAAAHASCFSMALSNTLAKAGFTAEQLDVDRDDHGRQARAGWTVISSHLSVHGRVPGADQAAFQSPRRRPRMAARSRARSRATSN